jgi:hypothetical protein
MKRDLKDWCIIKELSLDRRVKVSDSCSRTLIFNSFSFIVLLSKNSRPFLLFGLSVLLPFSLFFDLLFYHHSFSPSFSSSFCPCFLARVVSSLAYPKFLGTKMLDCCCRCTASLLAFSIATSLVASGAKTEQ